jgi:hypothetical protein
LRNNIPSIFEKNIPTITSTKNHLRHQVYKHFYLATPVQFAYNPKDKINGLKSSRLGQGRYALRGFTADRCPKQQTASGY